MSNLTVQRVRDADALPGQLFEQMEAISQKIRRRAHELFLARGAEPGRDLDDWLQAERELMWLPETQLIEKDTEFEARINVQGLEPKDIRIIAMANSIVLEAGPKSGDAKVFQRLDFSTPIDPDKVTARIERGILQLTAPKQRPGTASAAA